MMIELMTTYFYIEQGVALSSTIKSEIEFQLNKLERLSFEFFVERSTFDEYQKAFNEEFQIVLDQITEKMNTFKKYSQHEVPFDLDCQFQTRTIHGISYHLFHLKNFDLIAECIIHEKPDYHFYKITIPLTVEND